MNLTASQITNIIRVKGLGKKGTNLSNLGKECFGWYEVKDKKNCTQVLYSQGLPRVALVVKNLPANAADIKDMSSVPVSGRSPGEGNGNPLQYSCLENPMDRGAWQAIQSMGLQRVRHA